VYVTGQSKIEIGNSDKMGVEVSSMEIWRKAKEAGGAAADRVRDVTDHITGNAALRETEKFHQDMEAVYAALVSRVVSGEEQVERLERARKQTARIAEASVLLSVVALLIVLFR
jgi:hypothetical protein